MSPRRRTYENKDLPTGLSVVNVRGVKRFRFRRPDGKNIYFPQGTLRAHAIQAAISYNNEVRSVEAKLIAKTDKYNKRLSDWLPVVINRVKREEKLSSDTYKTFLQDCKRLDECLGDIFTKSINLTHVNDFLENVASGKSHNVYNRKISFLNKVFSYLVDMSAMESNFALHKKSKPKESKGRVRLGIDELKIMLEHAKNDRQLHWLYISMSLALQTTQATLEVTRMRYSDIQNSVLRVKRQKAQKHESSRVEIPVSNEIQKLIDFSRKSGLVSPYIVHRRGRYAGQIGEGCDHPLQVSSKYNSRAFSELRDSLGLYSNLPSAKRPTFHEIRALSIHLYSEQGIDPQTRAAHKDAKTTKIYKDGHVQWVRVPDAELKIV
uniref:tyrosine-type recombinase/integrase n=1 Tax=Ningiella ruwaisensis TaxID=2364274 RepID=UPI00109FED1C|nr:tyrosine-type recombinase/integrase [Ningiella ruwaisensis]